MSRSAVRRAAFVSTVGALAALVSAAHAGERWTSLAGDWRFALDPGSVGESQGWAERPLEDTIHLPGTTDEGEKGPASTARETQRLTRTHPYVGAAWYQRDLVVPPEWKGKRLVLVLERTKASHAFVDAASLGERDSLVAPHEYPLPALEPGSHRITVRVDNSRRPPVGDPHQLSDHTQTNWNGVVGEVGIRVTDPVWIEDVQVYPDPVARRLRVRARVGAAGKVVATGSLVLSVRDAQRGRACGAPQRAAFTTRGAATDVEADYPLCAEARSWDEFSPVLYTLGVALAARRGPEFQLDTVSVRFGLREFVAQDARFRVNGRPTFLRGKHDACVFPLTGYPPMTVEGWRRVFRVAKEWGINHYRFHTWCPPRAAFDAADELGVYLQPELPNWADFGEPAHDDFLRAEGERLLRAFGNHPSFVMLSLGNELGGRQARMAPFVSLFQRTDPRHLYAQGTNDWFPGPGAGDDYYASFQVAGKKVRGSFATVDAPLGHVQTGPPGTTKDYAAEIAPLRVPVVSHEVGEYQSYPDYREIEKYTGVLRAWNLEAFRERAARAGILDLAPAFHRASGALAALCYKEEVEAALRTPGFGGFQLLDLQDFPGQGTALVGLLDAFLDPKGFVSPDEWRRSCSETVPLLRFEKYAWTRDETFAAAAVLAHYGSSDLRAAPVWTLRGADGATVASGRLETAAVAPGSLVPLGEVRVPLSSLAVPARYEMELAIEGTAARNAWDLWVYPPSVEEEAGDVLVSPRLDDATLAALEAGARVLLMPEALPEGVGQAIDFAPDFWNFGMFEKLARERKARVAPGTLGIYCEPAHPALAAFPTREHADWQWFHLLHGARAVVVDGLPLDLETIVHVIDNAERAHRLAAVFQARVGRGRLLVSTLGLAEPSGDPAVRQLRASLLAYARSEAFAPRVEVGADRLRRTLVP
jgi:hypothetical protein